MEIEGMHRDEDSRRRWLIVACAWLMGFAMFAPILCVPPIEHIIKEELLITHEQIGLLFSLPILMVAALAIPGGLLADRIGIRKAAGIGAILMVAGSLARGASTNFETLLAFTALFGAGVAIVYPSLPKLVGAWFPREKAGLASGIYLSGTPLSCALALAITLPLVYPVTNTFQGTFYIWSIPVIVAALLWWIIVRDSPGSSTQRQRTIGRSVSLSLVWKNKNLWLAVIILFIINFHFYSWAGWTPALMMLKGASPELAAVITSVITWVCIPGILIIPLVSYKVGVVKPFIWGAALALVFVAWSAINASLPFFWPLMAIIGIAIGGAFPLVLSLQIGLVPEESVGAASGMLLSIGYIGGVIGPPVAGRILDTTGTLDSFLIVLGVLALAGAAVALFMPETGSRLKLRKQL